MKKILMAISLVLFLYSCSFDSENNSNEVDWLLYNGKILTMDSNMSIVSAVAFADGKILEVGESIDLIGKYVSKNTVNLEGNLALPGFIDSHTHLQGRPSRYIDLTKTTSIREIKDLVKAKVAILGAGEWISGYGWSEDFMEEKRRPLREDLDEVASKNPVLLTRAGGHSAVANSLALRLAEIDEKTVQPEGGVIEKDNNGFLNGVIRERQDIVGRLIPDATFDETKDSLILELKNQLALGITSFTQATGIIGISDHSNSYHSYEEWEYIYDNNKAELPRASIQLFWEGQSAMSEWGKVSGDGDEFLKVGPIKIFVDGGFTGPAAYTNEPYRGEEDYRGYLSIDPEELSLTIQELDNAGWQAGIHAIGDAAIELVVDELTQSLDQSKRLDHRHYLNHFTVMPSTETMQKMADYGIAITQQPNFTYTLEGRYVEYLDGLRLEHNNPLRTPMSHGIHLAISSDVLPIGPMVGLYAAVTRSGLSGRVFAEGEALTMLEALSAYTIGGAYLSFEEKLKGSIEPGKYADLIVLNQDLLEIEHSEIMDTKVLSTWLGGRLVYEDKSAKWIN